MLLNLLAHTKYVPQNSYQKFQYIPKQAQTLMKQHFTQTFRNAVQAVYEDLFF